MTEELNRLPLSKKGQRQVTLFIGNELLYDYISGILDEERKNAVEAYLKDSKEAQVEYQKIQMGLLYTEKLKQITVAQTLQQRLAAPSSYLSVLFKKSRFDQWPVGLKWGLEALVVVFVIVTFLTVAPWEKIMKLRLLTSNEVVLTEINKSPDLIEHAQQAPDIGQTKEPPQFVDEGIKASSKDSVATSAEPAQPPVAKTTPKPLPAAMPKSQEKVAVKVIEPVGAEETEEESAESVKENTGYLYRGQLAVTNLEAVGPKIKEKIIELGGRKAGEVELGWQKTPGFVYFHFTIPEAKYDELQAFLSEYGKARISKDKHPRMMPDGIIRLILSVEEAKK